MKQVNNQVSDGIKGENQKIFAMISHYLNAAADYVNRDEIAEIVSCGVNTEYAFQLIVASAFGLDIVEKEADRGLFKHYFNNMIHRLDVMEYRHNPYYAGINIPTIKIGQSELKYEVYKPYEGFVCNDILHTAEGRQIPQIGFFEEEFAYPAVLENDRIWMTITPNEIETMKEAVEQASGHVLVFGLGLGYYPYMISEKEDVESITIVEMNEDIINLFNRYIRPQFPLESKITLIQGDAFEYAEGHLAQGKYDFVFTDLWHDVSDGIDMYRKMKRLEYLSPTTKFSYWIEKSIKCYL